MRKNGFMSHGVDRAILEMAERAAAKSQGILDAFRNPEKIAMGVDRQGCLSKDFMAKAPAK